MEIVNGFFPSDSEFLVTDEIISLGKSMGMCDIVTKHNNKYYIDLKKP